MKTGIARRRRANGVPVIQKKRGQARERRTFYLFVKGEGGLRAGAR